MEITFTGHQLEVTPALKEFTRDKFEKIIRHYDRINSINVTFNVDKLQHTVEATISVPQQSIHASSESFESMYVAIDKLIEKLDKQIKRHKEKKTDHK
jgi:putative sigma-54 modulation protein